MNVQSIPPGVSFSKVQSSNSHISFVTFQWKEKFELWSWNSKQHSKMSPQVGLAYIRGSIVNHQGTANPTWGDIFECCFKTESSKLESLFSLKLVKRDLLALSFYFSKMSPEVVYLFSPSYRWWAEGSAEAPDSKVLPQWTLNLRVYAHTCTQTKEI